MGDNDSVFDVWTALVPVKVGVRKFSRWIMHTISNKVLIEVSLFFLPCLLLSMWWHKYFAETDRLSNKLLSNAHLFNRLGSLLLLFFYSFFLKFNRLKSMCFCIKERERELSHSFVLHDKMFYCCRRRHHRRYSYLHDRFACIKTWQANEGKISIFANTLNAEYDISLAVRWTRWDLLPHKLWHATKNIYRFYKHWLHY